MTTASDLPARSRGIARRDMRYIELLPVAVLTVAAGAIALLPAADFFPNPTDYLPIHTSLELCSVVVSVMVFGLGWNLRYKPNNSHIAILSATFLSVATLDILHILSYAGMPDLITPAGPEKAINFWLAARIVTAVGLSAVVMRPTETWSSRKCVALYAGAALLSLAVAAVGLYRSDLIPRTFIPGAGLTAFKTAVEYLIMAAYLVTAVLLFSRTVKRESYNGFLLASAAWTLGLGESFFTLYASVTDTFNLTGHIYKVIAYLFIYRAVFAEGVRAPYLALDEERRELRKLLQVAPDAILLVDPRDMRILQANPAAARLLGWSEEDLIHGNAGDLYALLQPGGEKTSDLFARVIKDLKQGQLITGERRLLTKTGDVRECEVRSIAVPDRHGHMLIRASFIDVTERKRAEASLAASEARLSALFNSTMHGIIGIDAQQRIVDFNAAAARIFGITPEDARGLPIETFIPERHRRNHAAMVRAFASEGAPASRPMGKPREVAALRMNGEEFPIEASISRVSVNGETTLTVMVRDVSELRFVEHQLQQAQKMETIGQLTGGMAHDFNNILTVIQANLEIMEADLEPGSSQRPLIAICNKAVDRGADLTKALLAIARRQPLAPRRTDTAALLNGNAALLHRILSGSITLTVDIADDVWPIRVDAAQMESALLNLAVNARDAMPQGGKLTIAARNVSLQEPAPDRDLPAGDYTAITISDTGSGMSPETAAKAFDPFFSTKGPKGTGLGLSMVHGFVTQSGGQILIESVLGQGSAITIYLPRCTDADPPDAG